MARHELNNRMCVTIGVEFRDKQFSVREQKSGTCSNPMAKGTFATPSDTIVGVSEIGVSRVATSQLISQGTHSSKSDFWM